MKFEGVTVKELLRLPILKDAKVIGGEQGLDRIVRFTDIMEVPDIKGWLREGELILTTGYSIRHNPALLEDVVEHLAQVNGAALAIKPERFLSKIPQEVIDKSNLYHIPIIQIPPGIPYIDITYTIMEQILDRQAALLRRSEEIYKALTNLVLSNSGIQVMADNVAELVQCPIWVISSAGDVLVSSPADIPYVSTIKTRHWEVTVDKQFVGKLIVGKEQLDEFEQVCIEQARLVFSLELMRRKIAFDTEVRLRGSFLEELLLGLPLSRQEVEDKGSKLGLLPGWIWEVGMVEGDSSHFEEQSPFLSELNALIQRESEHRRIRVRSHVLRQGDRLILLLATGPLTDPIKKGSVGRDDVKEWPHILSSFLAGWSGIRVGFGSKCSLWEVHRSYIEARKAIFIGTHLDRYKAVFTFNDVEMFQLLLDASEQVPFDALIERKIGKLCLYDKQNGTDLVSTLYYYLATGGSLMETANLLYVHRNSVKYRLDRIKEISDADLENPLNRFVYYLCAAFYLLKKED
ncbi:PucR family transcriptional regulator ligand-binding domain-containing protein [Paenibacillus filicis]|uniref:PucR family transcriptional regulator ligand-binding domain-containing protein n=1 Tax=Paenibacillus gyeongsangnamensis TaxID=3388067 RepID=A0ABT4QE20_9BACL|nr:PucR family transcriptional regulator ligand-binding domain-containing protein [Paenibacillus filicis]MCZ8515124.1 PucR family transcriptional regulator ligand-binding domain-containing protein [Paenibacillus filicis]